MVYPIDWNMTAMNMPGMGMGPPTGDVGSVLAMEGQMPPPQENWWDKLKGGAGDILGDPAKTAFMSQMLLKIMGDPHKTADLVGSMGQSVQAEKAAKANLGKGLNLTAAGVPGPTSVTYKSDGKGGVVKSTIEDEERESEVGLTPTRGPGDILSYPWTP